MSKLLSQFISAITGLWLATLFIPGVMVTVYPDSVLFDFSLSHKWQIFLLLGIAIGIINYFLKPIFKTLSLPLEVITVGIFSILANAIILWLFDLMFDELKVPIGSPWQLPLLYTAILIWILNLLIEFFFNKHK